MSARFEIVRTNAGWHSRFVAGNSKTVWTTEVYTRRAAALRAIRGIARGMSPTARIWVSNTYIAGRPAGSTVKFGHPDDDYMAAHSIEVREIDERYVPPPVVLDPPFYVTEFRQFTGKGRDTKVALVEFWHDSEHHSRNCYGDECTQGTPPIGTEVRGRMGTATFTGSES